MSVFVILSCRGRAAQDGKNAKIHHKLLADLSVIQYFLIIF
jgi:hypothetical protein